MKKNGVELIAEERQRQISMEGWDAEHDASHVNGEMAVAGACYALFDSAIEARALIDIGNSDAEFAWPWDMKWWKPDHDNAIHNLVRAGALIAAEIDRRQQTIPEADPEPAKLTEEQIDKEMAKLFNAEPVKMLTFMLVRAGKECVAANAETLEIKSDANIGSDRYKVEVVIKVENIGKAK